MLHSKNDHSLIYIKVRHPLIVNDDNVPLTHIHTKWHTKTNVNSRFVLYTITQTQHDVVNYIQLLIYECETVFGHINVKYERLNRMRV